MTTPFTVNSLVIVDSTPLSFIASFGKVMLISEMSVSLSVSLNFVVMSFIFSSFSSSKNTFTELEPTTIFRVSP